MNLFSMKSSYIQANKQITYIPDTLAGSKQSPRIEQGPGIEQSIRDSASASIESGAGTGCWKRIFPVGVNVAALVLAAAAQCYFPALSEPASPPAGHSASPATAAKKTYSHPAGPSQAVCQAYLGRLRSKLVNNWFLPDGNNNVTLTMNVSNDGSTGEIKPGSNPQNSAAETAAMDALSKCQPLEALPSGFISGAKLTISFVSKADPHGDSNSSINLHIDPVLMPKSEGASNASNSTAPAGSQASGTPASGTPESAGAPAGTAATEPAK